MPTYDTTVEFLRDYDRLTSDQKALFDAAVFKFRAALARGHLRPGLRVRGFRGTANTYEMTWALDGRALFRYGPPVREGHRHIIWRRVGGHDIFDSR